MKLRESGGFQDDSSFSSGAPGRCRSARAWARAQAVVYGTSITAVLGSIRNTHSTFKDCDLRMPCIGHTCVS